MVSIAPRAAWPTESPADTKKAAEKENEDGALHKKNGKRISAAPPKKRQRGEEERRRSHTKRRQQGEEEITNASAAHPKKEQRAAEQAEGEASQQKKTKVAKDASEVDEFPTAKRKLLPSAEQAADAEVAASEKALALADRTWEAAADAVALASDVSAWWDVAAVEADTEEEADRALRAARDAQDQMKRAERMLGLARQRLSKAVKARSELGYADKAAALDHVQQSDVEAFLFPVHGSVWGRAEYNGNVSDHTQASDSMQASNAGDAQ